MGETDDRSASRQLKAAEEAARILKPFGGEGAKKAHEVLENLRSGATVDSRDLGAVRAFLLDALMDKRVMSDAPRRKSAFLHVFVPEKPGRSEIRAAYKEFEAAFAKAPEPPPA